MGATRSSGPRRRPYNCLGVAAPEIINGRYEVVGTIGAGGMGVLYRARDPWIGGRVVALKLLKEGLDDEEIFSRFKQEASAAGVLEHENIVRIFDVGEHDGQPFIAMEYVDGDTLASLIRDRVAVTLLKKLEWVEQLCDALAYAHAHGIVHRDIKPLNLIIERRRQRLKVLDFGIAKVANSGITTAGMMIGTANYMSPEQMRGDAAIDHRSDIFSVGATVLELLTGTRAFPGSLSDGLMGRIMVHPAPTVRSLVPDLPEELDAIVARALEKDPNDRYGDLVQMRDEVRALRHRLKEVDEQTVMLPLPGGADGGPATATGRTGTSRGSTGIVPPPPPTLPPVGWAPGAPPVPPPPPPTMAVTMTAAQAAAPVAPATAVAAPVVAAPATGAPVPVPGAQGRSGNLLLFLGIVATVVVALAGAAWWLVPWDTVLRPWRGQEAAAPAGSPAVPATEAPTDAAAAERARALEAAKARLAGVAIVVDAQPWAEVRLVPALSDADVSALPPEVVRELAKERGPFVTPFVAEVPAGDYVASFENEGLGLSHTQRITVTAGAGNRFQVPMPGFDADRFVGDLLRGGAR